MVKQMIGFEGEQSVVLPQMIVHLEQVDPVATMLYVTQIGYYPHAVNHYCEHKTPLADCILIYCVRGAGWYSVDGGEVQMVRANQYFTLPAGKSHVYASDKQQPWTIYWIYFRGSCSDVYANEMQKPQTILPGSHSRINERSNIFEEILTTLSADYSIASLRYSSSLLHHYLASIRYVQQNQSATIPVSQQNDELLIDHCIGYMQENMEQRVTLRDLSDYTGYSVSHLSALFKRVTGNSPLHYFNVLKMKTACRYLSETDMKVNQICHKVGIEDCNYFSRLFTKMLGISPSDFRGQGARCKGQEK